ncbi:unnamed protein product [Arctogadus glacialis]
MGAVIFVESVITALGLLSEFREMKTNFRLGRLASEDSGTYHKLRRGSPTGSTATERAFCVYVQHFTEDYKQQLGGGRRRAVLRGGPPHHTRTCSCSQFTAASAAPDMATKIIYFTVNGRPERAELPLDCPAQDLKDLFRSAAEARPHDILKLYNPKGNLINISPRLEPNNPSSCYKLEVVAADCTSELLGVELAVALGFDLSTMEKRLQGLEKKILAQTVETPAVVYEMKKQVDLFREKLESVEHLSWLGLFKELSDGPHKPSPFYHKRPLRKTCDEVKHVRDKFLQMSALEVSEEVRQYLKTPSFDNW